MMYCIPTLQEARRPRKWYEENRKKNTFTVLHCIYLHHKFTSSLQDEKNPHIHGSLQFKPMPFMSQLNKICQHRIHVCLIHCYVLELCLTQDWLSNAHVNE